MIGTLIPGTMLDVLSKVWMSHGDRITRMPDGFVALAKSDNSPYAAIGDFTRKYFGVQFHPEVHHTPNGKTYYENFTRLAGFTGDWTMASFKDQEIAKILDCRVGTSKSQLHKARMRMRKLLEPELGAPSDGASSEEGRRCVAVVASAGG